MDARRCKYPPFRLAPWPGRRGFVRLAVIARAAIDQAEAEARELFRARGCEAEGPAYEMVLRAHLLAAASGLPVRTLLSRTSPAAMARLYLAWENLQSESLPDAHGLSEALRRGVCKDSELVLDGEAAYLAEAPSEFYGRPISELTDGELLYYVLIRAAFIEFHVEGKRKSVSREWLNRKD